MKINKVILVIDDEFIILESIKIQLERFFDKDGYVLEFASSGSEAFSIIEEYHFKNILIDLIITDYHLDDMKGSDIIYFIHERFPLSKKFILTGELDKQNFNHELRNIDIEGYIPKPWEYELLKNYVLNSLNI